jgi:hypothetical protein
LSLWIEPLVLDISHRETYKRPMKALVGVVLLLPVWGLVACGSSGDGAFSIRDVEYPDTVVSDGPRGNLMIYWSGSPTFPITAVFRPTEGGCPTGVTCFMPEQVFQEQESPLLFVDSPRCFGVTEQVVFDYEVELTDAEGETTERYPAPFVCVPQ